MDRLIQEFMGKCILKLISMKYERFLEDDMVAHNLLKFVVLPYSKNVHLED